MLVEKLRSLWADARSDPDPDTRSSDPSGDSDPEPKSKLFRCPECDVVYLALEKDRCSSCRSEVTEVSPTLTN